VATELNDGQKSLVAEWIKAGAGLSEVQKRILGEFGISMTYMDVRLLTIDLGVQVKNKVEPPPPKPVEPEPALSDVESFPSAAGDVLEDGADDGAGGNVTVGVDRIMKPGSLVSGTVRFSDGVSGTWMLDRMGRLALQTDTPGYRPSAPDLQSLQVELRKALERAGF